MRILAQITAYLLHPIFVPVLLMIFLMEVEPVMSLYFNGKLKLLILVVMLLNLIIGPIVSMVILKKNGWLDSLSMPSLRGRSMAYLITAMWYVLTFFMVQHIGLPIVTKALFIGLVAALLSLSLVSIRFKVSAHVAAVAGAMGVLCWMFSFYGIWQMSWFITGLLIIGWQASCRLYLQAHTEKQVFAGALIGFLSTYLCMLWIIG